MDIMINKCFMESRLSFSGSGYPLPPLSLAKNRLRTARVWMDEYSKLAEMFIHAPKADMGNIDRVHLFYD